MNKTYKSSMTEQQFQRFIILTKNLYKEHPNSITNYHWKLNRLNSLKIKNNCVYWLEVKHIFRSTEYLTLINALTKEEGYTLLKKDNSGNWMWNSDSSYKQHSSSLKGLRETNYSHPGLYVGVTQGIDPEIMTASFTTNPNENLSVLCDGSHIGDQLNKDQTNKFLKLIVDPKANQYWHNKIKYIWKNDRPAFTSYLGEKGNNPLILIGYNYNNLTGEFTPQYVSSILQAQYLSNFIKKPDFVATQSYKPDELLKLAALHYVLTNKSQFQTYNTSTKLFEPLDTKGVFLTNLPYQTPNMNSILVKSTPDYYHLKQELNNLDKSKNWTDWMKEYWPFQ